MTQAYMTNLTGAFCLQTPRAYLIVPVPPGEATPSIKRDSGEAGQGAAHQLGQDVVPGGIPAVVMHDGGSQHACRVQARSRQRPRCTRSPHLSIAQHWWTIS